MKLDSCNIDSIFVSISCFLTRVIYRLQPPTCSKTEHTAAETPAGDLLTHEGRSRRGLLSSDVATQLNIADAYESNRRTTTEALRVAQSLSDDGLCLTKAWSLWLLIIATIASVIVMIVACCVYRSRSAKRASYDLELNTMPRTSTT